VELLRCDCFAEIYSRFWGTLGTFEDLYGARSKFKLGRSPEGGHGGTSTVPSLLVRCESCIVS